MDSELLNGPMQQWVNDLLVWIGFGTLVGLLAKAIMPGRDPGGAIATLAMGIGGSVIGCATLSYFHEGPRVTPISLLGLVVATGGAFVLLLFYRLLGGYFFVEGDVPLQTGTRRSLRSRRAGRRATSTSTDRSRRIAPLYHPLVRVRNRTRYFGWCMPAVCLGTIGLWAN